MSDEEVKTAEDNVAIAFALVVAAGCATGLGAAAVFVPSIVKLASRRVLAGSLGFSAGVMTYVSFVEIFQKANLAFLEADQTEGNSYLYATLCFFAGVLLMMMLNLLVAALLGGHSHGPRAAAGGGNDPTPATRRESESSKNDDEDDDDDDDDDFDDNKQIITGPTCCDRDPVNKLERIHSMANKLEHEHQTQQEGGGNDNGMNLDEDIEDDFVDNIPIGNNGDDGHSDISDDDDDGHHDQKTKDENKRLVAMGMNTAGAIALHNFPEGLATFVAALDDPRVGAILATAIAIHNIPEGLCVALPIFYATGKRMNAFCWALLSGASEIVAALLGWAVLAGSFSHNTYGVLFGIVAGMMVMISVRELLPTAHFYDPQDTVVTYSYIFGMIVMAFSLVLFVI